MKVLITYASWHGSTAQIAQRIAEVLARSGLMVDTAPVAEVHDVAGYDAVVLGSAVHNQAWAPEAADFAHRQSAALAQRPVWLFSVGMSGGLPRPVRRMAATGQDQRITAALQADLQPRGHQVFSGVCRPEQLPRWVGIAFRGVGGHFGDYRDWAGIEGWAEQIARELDAASVDRGP